MDEMRYTIAMRDYKTGREKELGEKWAPWKQSIEKLISAYEIIAYPLLERSYYGNATRELARDAQAHPDIDTQEHPNRAAIELNDEELRVLGMLTQARGLPFDPEKREYRYTELIPQLDSRNEAILQTWRARTSDKSQPRLEPLKTKR
jgi:hypothetical protein